jgi:hypothetical protein
MVKPIFESDFCSAQMMFAMLNCGNFFFIVSANLSKVSARECVNAYGAVSSYCITSEAYFFSQGEFSSLLTFY